MAQTFIPTTTRHLSTRAKEAYSRDGWIGALTSLLAIGESQRAEPRGAAPASPAVPAAGSVHCLHPPRAAPSTCSAVPLPGWHQPPSYLSASAVTLTRAEKPPPASQHWGFIPEGQHWIKLCIKLWWVCCLPLIQLDHAWSSGTFSPPAQWVITAAPPTPPIAPLHQLSFSSAALTNSSHPPALWTFLSPA